MPTPAMRPETRALFDAALATLKWLRMTMRTEHLRRAPHTNIPGPGVWFTLEYGDIDEHAKRLEDAIEAIDPTAIDEALRQITNEMLAAKEKANGT